MIQARFTVKDKVEQEMLTSSPGLDLGVAKGLVYPERRRGVKFLVDVFDETGETVAIATILTITEAGPSMREVGHTEHSRSVGVPPLPAHEPGHGSRFPLQLRALITGLAGFPLQSLTPKTYLYDGCTP